MISAASVHDEPTRKLTKDYVFIPSGQEGDSVLPEFYISAIEVTNRQYRDFLTELRDSGATAKLLLANVDSTQWNQFVGYGEPMVVNYFQHPAYDDYPVVNISKRGAELYCEWLTERYNRASSRKLKFSLPTELQWTYAARGGNPKAIYPWVGTTTTYQKKGKWHGKLMCNYRVDSVTVISETKIYTSMDFTAPSQSYMPNTYDIYNMAGNVAEMIADQSYTKGGSYNSLCDKLLISAHEDADLSHGSPFIGFRPVMVYE